MGGNSQIDNKIHLTSGNNSKMAWRTSVRIRRDCVLYSSKKQWNVEVEKEDKYRLLRCQWYWMILKKVFHKSGEKMQQKNEYDLAER